MLVKDIYGFMNDIAPFETAQEWDNSGLLLGSFNATCTKVMLALDVTQEVARQAEKLGVQLIVSHHPVIFSPLRRIDCDSAVAFLATKGIAVISSHTCFDSADGGMNDILCEKIGLANVRPIECNEENFTFRIGVLPNPVTVEKLANNIASALSSKCVCCSHKDKTVEKIAVCSGAGSSLCREVIDSGADAFVTGEIKYSNLLELYEHDIAVVTAGHFETESIFKKLLKEWLQKKFPELEVFIAEETAYLTGV